MQFDIIGDVHGHADRLDETKPVFFGHYCLEEAPQLQTSSRACLDFCVAKGGALCAYRFDGEPELDPANLAWVG